MSWVALSMAGFLLGSFLYSGWYTTRYEPEVRVPYAIVGAGIVTSVATNIWLEVANRDVSNIYRALTLLTYVLVAAGLILLSRTRRRSHL